MLLRFLTVTGALSRVCEDDQVLKIEFFVNLIREILATPEPAKDFLESSQAGIDQKHLDSTHHLTR